MHYPHAGSPCRSAEHPRGTHSCGTSMWYAHAANSLPPSRTHACGTHHPRITVGVLREELLSRRELEHGSERMAEHHVPAVRPDERSPLYPRCNAVFDGAAEVLRCGIRGRHAGATRRCRGGAALSRGGGNAAWSGVVIFAEVDASHSLMGRKESRLATANPLQRVHTLLVCRQAREGTV